MPAFHFDRELNSWDADYYFMGRLPVGNVAMTAVGITETEPDIEAARSGFRQVAERVGRFRQGLRAAPLNALPPTWIFREDFDVNRHLPHIQLPPGSNIDVLFRTVDELQSKVLDPHEPPWSFTFVTGLAGGRAASILRLHHCLSDGTALGLLFGSMSGLRDRDDPALSVETTTESASASRAAATVGTLARQGAALGSRSLGVARSMLASAQRAELLTAVREVIRAPQRPGGPSIERRSCAFQVSLAEWRAAAKSRGGGVNELYLALAASLWLDYLSERGDRPRSVRVAMPVNVRRSSERQAGGNTIGVGYIDVSTAGDPLDSLPQIADLAAEAKARAIARPDTAFDILKDAAPGPIRGQLAFRRSSWPDVSATNLVSPVAFDLGGLPMVDCFLLPPAIGSPISMSLFTYQDKISITVNTDAGMIEDQNLFLDVVAKRVGELGFGVPVIGAP